MPQRRVVLNVDERFQQKYTQKKQQVRWEHDARLEQSNCCLE